MNSGNAPVDSFLPPLSALVGAELSYPLPGSPAEEQDAATSREQPEAPAELQAQTSTFAAMDLDSGAPALTGPQHMEQVMLGSAMLPVLPEPAAQHMMPPQLLPALTTEQLLEELNCFLQLSVPSQPAPPAAAGLLPLSAPAPLPALPLFQVPTHQQDALHAAPVTVAPANHQHLISITCRLLDQWPNTKDRLKIFSILTATLDVLKQANPGQPLSALLPGCYYDSFPEALLAARGAFSFLGPYTLPEGCRLNLGGPKTGGAKDYEAKVGTPGRQHAMAGVSGTRPEESAEEERLARRWAAMDQCMSTSG